MRYMIYLTTRYGAHATELALRITLFSVFCFLVPTSQSLLFGNPPDTLWSRTYGGADIDVAYSVCESWDGCYVAAGYTSSYGAGLQDAYLIKVDANGDTVWTRTFGGASMDGAHFVRATADSGYMIAAYTETFGGGGKNVYLIKTDADGIAEHTAVYATPLQDVAYVFCEASDSGYIFVGYKNGPSGWIKGDLWILKTDATLDTIWAKEYGGTGEDYGISIRPTSDGGYIISGTTSSFGAGGKDLWLVKIDADGDTAWTKTYGGSLDDVGYGVSVTADNGYIITGYINGTPPWYAGDVWLLKTDSSGDTLWTRIYGGGYQDFGFDVYQTPDNGYVIAGQGYEDVWLLRTNSLGDTVWTQRYGGANHDAALALYMTSDGGYIIGGHTTSFGNGANDFWLIKTEPDVGIQENSRIDIRTDEFYTRIISGQLELPEQQQYRVYDIAGRIANRNHLSPGIYFIEVEGAIVGKVVKVK